MPQYAFVNEEELPTNINSLSYSEILALVDKENEIVGLCGHRLFVKPGKYNSPHFSHFRDSDDCPLESAGGGESEEHMYWKHKICAYISSFQGWKANVEVSSDSKQIRADVEAVREDGTERVCFEYQKSYQSDYEYISRTKARLDSGYDRVIWINPHDKDYLHWIPMETVALEILYLNTEEELLRVWDTVWGYSNQCGESDVPLLEGVSLILEGKVVGWHYENGDPRDYYILKNHTITMLSEFEPLIVPRTGKQYEELGCPLWVAKAEFHNKITKQTNKAKLCLPSITKPEIPRVGVKYSSPRSSKEGILRTAKGWFHAYLYRMEWPLEEVR